MKIFRSTLGSPFPTTIFPKHLYIDPARLYIFGADWVRRADYVQVKARKSPMSEADNVRLMDEAFSAMNAHDLDRYVSNQDDSYVWDSDAFPAPVRGRDAVKQTLQMYFTAFPDLHFERQQIIASGDSVVVRWEATGTHKGDFNGIPPTNKRITSRGCTVSEVKNGRFVKASTYMDQLALLRQMGVPLGKAA